MNYTPMIRNDFDKSFKYEKQSFLCYSKKKLKEITAGRNFKIVGLARRSDKETENKLVLGSREMAVFDPEKDKNDLIYRSIGFIPVSEDDSYIAVQENRLPLAAAVGTMAAVTTVVCLIITNMDPIGVPELVGPMGPEKPSVNAAIDNTQPQFNPLPPVDTNIEDADNTAMQLSNDTAKANKGGGKVSISYKRNATLYLSNGEVKMEYQNPASSSHDAVVELCVVSGGQEYLIARSGRVPAGKKIQTMQLTADKNLFGGEGKYNAEYRVIYYNPVTGERALAEAAMDDITLTVKNG